MRLFNLLLLAALSFSSVFGEVQKSNIVFIFADDLGYGDIQCLNPNRGKIPTPGVDLLAAEGLIFTDAHTTSSVCTPSRYGLLTGRYNWRSKLQKFVLSNAEEPLIASDRMTLGNLLQQQGYQTACIGKWHLGFKFDVADDFVPKKVKLSAGFPVGTKIIDGPQTRGFDYYFGFHHARWMSTLIEKDEIIAEIDVIEMLPRMQDKAIGYINDYGNSKREKPFFLYLPLGSPHTPIVPSAEWQGKSPLGPYGDFVMQSDAVVGAVINTLKANDLDGDTLVIFSSDNGCSKAAKIDKLIEGGHYPSANLRGSKADLWDGGHRVPFVMRWPNGPIQAGTRSDELISLVDVFATFSEMQGVALPEHQAEDSFSFLPAISGGKLDVNRKGVIHHSISGLFALRNNQYKLLLCPGSGGWSSPKDSEARKESLPEMQLYDMSIDVSEQNNLINEKPEVAEMMLKTLKLYVANGRTREGTGSANDVEVDLWKKNKKKTNKK